MADFRIEDIESYESAFQYSAPEFNDSALDDFVTDLKVGTGSAIRGIAGGLDLLAEGGHRMEDQIARENGREPPNHGETLTEWLDKQGLNDWIEDQQLKYSPERWQSDQEVTQAIDNAEGIAGKVGAAIGGYLTHPRSALGVATQSIPSIAASVAPGVGASRVLGVGTGAVKALTALGEGGISAGNVAANIIEDNVEHGRKNTENIGYAIPTGIGVALVAGVAGKFGGSVEDALVNREVSKTLPKGASGIAKSTGAEFVEEGAQAPFETVPENLATGKPWEENLGENIGTSAVTGGGFGFAGASLAKTRDGLITRHDKKEVLDNANKSEAKVQPEPVPAQTDVPEPEQTPPSTVPPTDPSEETADEFDYTALPDADDPEALRAYAESLQAEVDAEKAEREAAKAQQAPAVDQVVEDVQTEVPAAQVPTAEDSVPPATAIPPSAASAPAPVMEAAPAPQEQAEPETTATDWRKVFRGLYDPSKPVKQSQLDELKRARQSPFGESVMVALANASRAVSGNKPPFSAHNIAALTDNLTDGAETVEDIAQALEAEADRMPARQENADKMDAYRLAAALLRNPDTDVMAFMEAQRQQHLKAEEEAGLARAQAEAERIQKRFNRENAAAQHRAEAEERRSRQQVEAVGIPATATSAEPRLTRAERKAQNQAAWRAKQEERDRQRMEAQAAKTSEAPKSESVAQAQTESTAAPQKAASVETPTAKEPVDPPLKWDPKAGPVKTLRQWAKDYEAANGEKPTQAQMEAKSRQLTDENGLDKYQDIHAKQFNDVVKGGVTNVKKGTREIRRDRAAYYEGALKRGLEKNGPMTDKAWTKFLQEDFKAETEAGRVPQSLIESGFVPNLRGIGHKGDESVRLKHGKVARELAEKDKAAKAVEVQTAAPEAPKAKPKRTRAKKKAVETPVQEPVATPAATEAPAQETPTPEVATDTVAPTPAPAEEAPAKPKRTRKSAKKTADKPAEPAPAKTAQEALVERLKAQAAARGVTQENIDTVNNTGETQVGPTIEEAQREAVRKKSTPANERSFLATKVKPMKKAQERVRFLQNYVNETVSESFEGDRVSRLTAVSNILLNKDKDFGLGGEALRNELSRTLNQAMRSPLLSDEERTAIAKNMRNNQPVLSESADATIKETRAMEEAERAEAAEEDTKSGWKSGFASLREDMSNDTSVRDSQQQEAASTLGTSDVTDNSSAYAGLESDIEDAQNRDAARHGSEGEDGKGGGLSQNRTKSTGRWGESWAHEAQRRVMTKVNKALGNPVKARDMEAGNYGPLYEALQTSEGQVALDDALDTVVQEMVDADEKYDIARNKKFSKKIDLPAAITEWTSFLDEAGVQLDNDPVLAHLLTNAGVEMASTETTQGTVVEEEPVIDEGPSEEERIRHRASFANAVKKSRLYDVVEKLIKDGKLEIVNNPEDVLSPEVIKAEIKANPGKVIKGAYDRKTGKVYLFMDNIGNHEIDTVLLHEVGVHMLGDDAFLNRLAFNLAAHINRHFKDIESYEDLREEGMKLFRGYDFNNGKLSAEQEEWVATALSTGMREQSPVFRGFLGSVVDMVKQWYGKITGSKQEPSIRELEHMVAAQMRTAIDMGRAAKMGDDKVLFYSAMRDEDAAQSITDKLPKSIRKAAINAQHRFFKTGLGMMFTKDLVDYAKSKGILGDSLQRYTQAEEAIQTFRNDWESRVAGTGRKFQELTEAEQTEVNRLLADSTLEGVWAYVDDELFPTGADWGKVYAKYTDGQKAKMQEMQKRFNRLSPKARQVVKEVFRQGNTSLNTLLDVIEKNVEKNFQSRLDNAKTKEDKERIERELKAEKRRLRKLVSADPTKPYAPLRRFGNHVVVMKSKRLTSLEALIRTAREMANERTGGKPAPRDLTVVKRLEAEYEKLIQNPSDYLVEFVESAGDAQLRKEELVKENPGNAVSAFEKALWLRDEVPGWQQLEQSMKMFKNSTDIDAAVAGKNVKQSDLDEIEAMLRELYVRSLTDASARKSELKRRKVSGFNQNMMASFLEAERANAVRLAQIKFGGDLRDALSDMQKEARVSKDEATAMRFVNEFRARHAQSLRPGDSKLVNRTLRTTSVFMLLTNPAFHLMNLTQPFMMTAPYMAARHGNRAVTELAKTIKDVGMAMRADSSVDGLKNAKFLKEGEFEALDRARDAGHIDIGITQDFGQSMGKPNVLSKVVDRLTTATRAAETMNRTASFLTAYRLEYARTGDKDAAYRYADDVVYRTHGDYSGFNAPRYFNMNGFTKIATQFRKFQLIQLSLMLRMANQAFAGATPEERAVGRRALAYTMGIHFALTGLKGTPFIGTVMMLASMALGMGDDGDDSEDKIREWIEDKDLADVLLNGLPFGMGVDLSSKLGAGQMLSIAPYADLDVFNPNLTGKDIAQRAALSALGAAGSLGAKQMDAAMAAANGDFQRAVQNFLPTGLANVAKALKMGSTGITTKSGDVAIPSSEFTAGELVMQALGIPLSKTAERNRMLDTTIRHEKNFDARADKIRKAYKDAARNSDAKGMREARRDFEQLRKDMKAESLRPLPISSLTKSVKAQRKREANMVNGVAATKANREFLKKWSNL